MIPHEDLDNIFIKVPVNLETYFVQGSYNRILNSQQNVPLMAYHFFIDRFVDAIRYEIARSAERSYDSLKIKDMNNMFMIDNESELREFIQSNNMKEGIEWRTVNDRVEFGRERKEINEIPAMKMINLSLDYATELNRII
mmetsp:Transcript_43083/g.31077  ORF Transcript_43083/g.31077 Transcript_43083/m.31077 type:complete len:140 (+) Transcript_43083:422-841(+)